MNKIEGVSELAMLKFQVNNQEVDQSGSGLVLRTSMTHSVESSELAIDVDFDNTESSMQDYSGGGGSKQPLSSGDGPVGPFKQFKSQKNVLSKEYLQRKMTENKPLVRLLTMKTKSIQKNAK